MGVADKPRWLLVIFVTLGVALAIGLIAALVQHEKPVALRGAVVKQDTDPRKQSPITGVSVTAVVSGKVVATAKSDFSGYFKLTLPRPIRRGRSISLQFSHTDYVPLDMQEIVGNQIYVAHLQPLQHIIEPPPNQVLIAITNVFVRYTTETSTRVNIGTGLRTFEIVNKGNVPCERRPPCSPDGRWKAATASVSLDAGPDNVYEDARLTCIAGPCPFTKVVSDNFSAGGRVISATVLGWSDTTTFLLQAEVFREEIGDTVRESYPVIFGDSLNFTLPASAEGPSFEAEVNGTNIVFPLAPNPILSWADCVVRVGKDQSKLYRCELKPGYRFR
ncbi:MAG TPA: hypothetical protein VMD77_15970 [Candidatus Baltobacteraceae bacterium]|jgi:hypothetical protein|nr:hypothetical protein [Candidatus Baltobacteraceae bacterium]